MSTQNISNSTIEATQIEIAVLNDQLRPMLARMEALKIALEEALSSEFIAVNKITRDDVEMSNGDGKPYFTVVHHFGKWLKANSTKTWAEWNGRIYHTSDLVNGRMPDMPASVESLPNNKLKGSKS